MTDQEIVIHLAEKVMGWEVFSLQRQNYDEFRHSIHRLVENVEHNWNFFPPGKPGNLWNPLESRDDCAEVQAALKAGQIDRYIEALLDGWPKSGFNEYWWLIQLTPRQRCLAIVEATK